MLPLFTTNQHCAGYVVAFAGYCVRWRPAVADRTLVKLTTIMTILGRPVGVWLLALWAAAHVVAAIVVAVDASGMKSIALWILIAGELSIVAGLILGWRAARYLLMAQVALHVTVFALLAWAFVFVAFAWGLHGSDGPIIAAIATYLTFVCWAFTYLFHPGVLDYFDQWLGAQALSRA